MAYTATIINKQVQNGKTYVTIRLLDNAGVMPEVITSYTWNKIIVTNADLIAARNKLISNAVNMYNIEVTKKIRQAAFREKLEDWLNNRITTLQTDYLAAVESSNLTENQKEYAKQVTFKWEIGD